MKTPRTSRVYAWEGVSEASGASGLCEREAYLRHLVNMYAAGVELLNAELINISVGLENYRIDLSMRIGY